MSVLAWYPIEEEEEEGVGREEREEKKEGKLDSFGLPVVSLSVKTNKHTRPVAMCTPAQTTA